VKQFNGKTILDKIAIGKIYFYRKQNVIRRYRAKDAARELERYEKAKAEALETCERMEEKAKKEADDSVGEIFAAQAMICMDEEFSELVRDYINKAGMTAEAAVNLAGNVYAERFESMEDAYIKDRAADIKDAAGYLIEYLTRADANAGPAEPAIVVAVDLTPAETVRMERENLLGFVTRNGSFHSHTAILARSMGTPALLGVNVNPAWHGKTAILDGEKGILILDPEESLLEEYQKKLLLQEKEAEESEKEESGFGDGKSIRLCANIGDVCDLDKVKRSNVAGIGLFRSEFLFLSRKKMPGEEEQFRIYKQVLEAMGERNVTIRTLDIGSDKKADYFHLEKEENPALGYRAVRLCLRRKDVFRTQLRALYRASAYGNLSILFPMITTMGEVEEIKALCKQVREELRAEGTELKQVPLGIMIETPAAALISDLLADEVDFFSIGTNDLMQYTLAADRENARLDALFDPSHPAIVRLLNMIVNNGHAKGCKVCICGELGADVSRTEELMRMGIDEISVSLPALPGVRRAVKRALNSENVTSL